MRSLFARLFKPLDPREDLDDYMDYIEKRHWAIAHLASECVTSIANTAAGYDEIRKGYSDMYAAFEALGVTKDDMAAAIGVRHED